MGGGIGGAGYFFRHDELGFGFGYIDPAQYAHSVEGMITRVIRHRCATPAQSLSPALAGVLFAVLVLSFPFVRRSLETRYETECRQAWMRRCRIALSILLVASALIGLNLTAELARPPSPASEIKFGGPFCQDCGPSVGDYFGIRPTVLNIRVDGRVAMRRQWDGSDVLSHSTSRFQVADFYNGEKAVDEVTIDHGLDDSIVTYGGTYEHMLSKPRVVRPATRSRFDIWWAPVASALITMFVVVDLGLRIPAWRNTQGRVSTLTAAST